MTGPAHPAHPPPPAAPAPPDRPRGDAGNDEHVADEHAAGRVARVLVVDDTEGNRYAMARLLRRAGMQVTEAETAADARRRLSESVPDLVILDINLPDGSGHEVLQEIRSAPATAAVPVMHVSASFISNADRVYGLEQGADAYLTHPLDPDVFLATARALLRAEGERARLYHTEHQARRAAESAAARAALLQDLTAMLARTMSAPEVSQVVLTRAFAALDAVVGMLAVVTPDGRELELLGSANVPQRMVERWRRYPVAASAPMADAVRAGAPVSLGTRAEMTARYPEREGDVFSRLAGLPRSLYAAPMVVDRGPTQRVLGAMLFMWVAEHAVGPAEAALIGAVSDQCALALERARLYDAERAARAAAQAAESRLRDVFEQVPMAVAVLTGPDHVYTVASPRYADFGAGRPLIGRPVRDAFPELAAQGFVEIMDRVYETGEPYFAPGQTVLLDRNGDGVPEEYVFDISYQPLRTVAGRVYAIASVALDVSEQARARSEVERARDEAVRARAAAEAARADAEQANAAKAQFLTTMSHELRTPLNAIGGYAQLIEMGIHGPVTESQATALARIQQSQEHLLGLINSVLNYAKLEAGRVEYAVTDVPVLAAVRAVEALVAPQARAKGITLRVDDCPPELAVRADTEKLRQVLLNLLSNAVKFTEAGAVTVSCAPAPDERTGAGAVELRVHDTGRGIPADHLGRIFEPFVQVGRRLASSDEGTGLGLAISRDLARAMGGDLRAESTVGVGSTFILALPQSEG